MPAKIRVREIVVLNGKKVKQAWALDVSHLAFGGETLLKKDEPIERWKIG